MIYNADDLGLTKKSTECIIDLLNKNYIDTASLLTNMPYTEYAIKLINLYNLKHRINLHFNITQGKSLSGINSLTDKNGFMHISNKYNLEKINFQDIVKEFHLQKNTFPEYKNIDCHNNVNYKNDKLHLFLKKYSNYVRIRQDFEELDIKTFMLFKNNKNIYLHPSYKDDFEIDSFNPTNLQRYVEYLFIKNINKN